MFLVKTFLELVIASSSLGTNRFMALPNLSCEMYDRKSMVDIATEFRPTASVE